jgi:hypothetical protein
MTATLNPPAHLRTDVSVARSRATLVGTSPRVSLIPPEITERHKQRGVQRGMRLGVFGVLVVVLAGIAGCWYLATMSQLALVEAQNETTTLLAQQAEFAETQNSLNAVALGEAALAVGGSTEIDWQDYLGLVQGSLPAGVTLDTFNVDASTVTENYPQSDVPLQGARIATLQFSAISPGIPEIPSWLDALRKLPGFVDAVPGSVIQREVGDYIATITMHIDAEVYTNRLVAEPEGDGTADEDDANEPEDGE